MGRTLLYLFLGLVLLSVIITKRTSETASEANATAAVAMAAAVPFVPYSDRLAQAKDVEARWRKALASKSAGPSILDIDKASTQVSSIPSSAPEFADAKKVSARLAEDHKLDQSRKDAEAAKLAAVEGPRIRRAMVGQLEHEFLMKGYDATFTVEGQAGTTLRMKYVFVGRPLVEQMRTDGVFLQRCTDAGFKKVVLDDGFGKSWTFTL